MNKLLVFKQICKKKQLKIVLTFWSKLGIDCLLADKTNIFLILFWMSIWFFTFFQLLYESVLLTFLVLIILLLSIVILAYLITLVTFIEEIIKVLDLEKILEQYD